MRRDNRSSRSKKLKLKQKLPLLRKLKKLLPKKWNRSLNRLPSSQKKLQKCQMNKRRNKMKPRQLNWQKRRLKD